MVNKQRTADVRLQFLLLLLVGFYAFLSSFEEIYIICFILLIGLILQGFYSLFFKYTLFLLGFITINYCISVIDSHNALNYLGIFIGIGTKFFPSLIIAASINQVPLGKIIASLGKLKFPNSLLLTLAVGLRFFPVLLSDIKIIQDNAYVRKLSYKNFKNWLNPLTLFEFTVVPLLLRTIQLADDLAANGTTRGISFPGNKTSFYTIKFVWFDLIYCVTLGTLLIIFLVSW